MGNRGYAAVNRPLDEFEVLFGGMRMYNAPLTIGIHPMKTIFLLLISFVLLGCGKTPSPAAIETFATGGGPSDVQMLVASDDFPVGRPRVPLLLRSGLASVSDAQRVQLTAFDLSSDPPQAGWTGEAVNYNDYTIPYWVAYPELPTAGLWGLQAAITKADGTVTSGQIAIQTSERTLAPAIGNQPPTSKNRTLATEPDLRKLSSAADPNPAFYQMTVAEAMTSGRPSVVVFATPGFCQTALCTPVLESVEQLQPTFENQVNFIHIEIYKAFNPELVVDDTVTEWNLSSEPWTFVLDQAGKVFARFGGPVSPKELQGALEELLK